MKKLSIATLLFGALAVAMFAPPARAEVNVNVSVGGFHDELAPYGRWINCRYGQCWIPERVNAGWQPYTNGQWVYTEYGWTWMSDDPWGGNPYHYGTWTSLDQYGWSWVPGTVWSPAWVTWSYNDRYVGWAPLPPTVAFGSSGYNGRAVVLNPKQYVFVPTNRFVGGNITSARVARQQNAMIFRQTKPVTRFDVSRGIVRNTAIPVATIQRASGSRIETRNVSDARTTPREMMAGPAGKRQRVSIVAPARELNAAFAGRSRPGSRSATRSPESQRTVAVKRERQSPPQKTRQDRNAPTAHEASPAPSRAPAARAAAPRRQEVASASRRSEVSHSEPHRAVAPAAVATRRQPPVPAHASPTGRRAPAPAARPASPNQRSKNRKPLEKDRLNEKN